MQYVTLLWSGNKSWWRWCDKDKMNRWREEHVHMRKENVIHVVTEKFHSLYYQCYNFPLDQSIKDSKEYKFGHINCTYSKLFFMRSKYSSKTTFVWNKIMFWSGLVWFYGISVFVGYLIPNRLYSYALV